EVSGAGVFVAGQRLRGAGVQEVAEPGPGPGEPGADDGRGQAEHLGDLPRLQPLPQVEGQHLLVATAEPGHRDVDLVLLDDGGAVVGDGGGEVVAQPLAQPGPPGVAAP